MGCNNNYSQCKQDKCQCKQDKCKMILTKYHHLIKKADCLYNDGNHEVEEAIANIKDALQHLENYECYTDRANEIYTDADEYLENSSCGDLYNGNLCRCKKLGAQSEELYNQYEQEVYEATKYLEKIFCKLNEAIDDLEKADKVYAQYIACIHGKSCC